MSRTPFDNNSYPSPYPPRAGGDSTYPPQNYDSDLNPWSTNQANPHVPNAYDYSDNIPSRYNTETPNPYAQSPAYSYQPPASAQESPAPPKTTYGGASAYEHKEPTVPSSTLSSKPSTLGHVPSITTAGTNNPVPLAPLHANRAPNRWRVLLRFIGLIGSIGAFGFSVGAGPYSGRATPFADKSAIIFLYIWSAVSIIAHVYFLLNMLNRKVRNGSKVPRKWLLIADIVLGVCWGFDVVFLIAKNHCPVGKLDGWCDFFNTSIFFAFLTFVATVTSIFWDLYGWYVERKHRLA
ncbi:hypothetical protein K493DRAFT_295987 [Basidiobolus meristosporus CBS 931.73]|uniref:MARVEL domain-containing protein n=1 Tax=Basidiobolus meristosporus CBS 931.73 TaxID=1314790 RepID=A0A1Y1Z8W1_9FUNG|nr:hypothetical protein K493DRAFT_295987 [Basidiobolus meristosporus CBS 931.73]|eukprot:ORY06457.1 hypothetical protein K493DRAFT_295987 [Basidiobolus meristosporus CBS 931.73]